MRLVTMKIGRLFASGLKRYRATKRTEIWGDTPSEKKLCEAKEYYTSKEYLNRLRIKIR